MNWFGRRRPTVADLASPRLRLVAITAEMMASERAADGSLARLLGARLTPEWPPEHWEPHVFDFITTQLEEHPRTAGWNRYVLLPAAKEPYTLIGCVGGFVKPGGDVEMGYSTLPEFQRTGYATEAAQALIAFLFTQPDVLSVSAQTFPTLPESIKVMERCGMDPVGPGDAEGTIRYRRMR